MTPPNDAHTPDDRTDRAPGSEATTQKHGDSDATGLGGFAERITGENDPRDPDGLITLDDLADRAGHPVDPDELKKKTTAYGDGTE